MHAQMYSTGWNWTREPRVHRKAWTVQVYKDRSRLLFVIDINLDALREFQEKDRV